MAETSEAPASLKITLTHPRRLRAFGSLDIGTYAKGDTVELPNQKALELVATGLAEAVSANTKSSKTKASKASKAAE